MKKVAAIEEENNLRLTVRCVKGRDWEIEQDHIKMGLNWKTIADAMESVLGKYGLYQRQGKKWKMRFREDPTRYMLQELESMMSMAISPFGAELRVDYGEVPDELASSHYLNERPLIPAEVSPEYSSKRRSRREAKRVKARRQPDVEKGTIQEVIERYPLMEPLNAKREAAWKISHLIRSGDIDVVALLEYAEKIVK